MLQKGTRVQAKPGSLAEQGSAGTVEAIMADGTVYVAWDKHRWWNGYIMERAADLEVVGAT